MQWVPIPKLETDKLSTLVTNTGYKEFIIVLLVLS